MLKKKLNQIVNSDAFFAFVAVFFLGGIFVTALAIITAVLVLCYRIIFWAF